MNNPRPVRPPCTAAHRLGARRAAAMGRRRQPVRRCAGQPAASGHPRGGRPGAARHAQPAFARLPARLRRPHRIPRPGAGQLLELAHADVPLRRGDHAGAAGRRSRPACTSRCWRPATPACASSTTCTTTPTAGPMPTTPTLSLRLLRAAARAGIGLDAAAGAVPDQRLRRHAAARRPAPLHPQHRFDAAPAGAAAAAVRGARRAPGPGAAFAARRAAGEPARKRGRA